MSPCNFTVAAAASRWLLLHGEEEEEEEEEPYCWVQALGADHNLSVFNFIKGNMVFSQI